MLINLYGYFMNLLGRKKKIPLNTLEGFIGNFQINFAERKLAIKRFLDVDEFNNLFR